MFHLGYHGEASSPQKIYSSSKHDIQELFLCVCCVWSGCKKLACPLTAVCLWWQWNLWRTRGTAPTARRRTRPAWACWWPSRWPPAVLSTSAARAAWCGPPFSLAAASWPSTASSWSRRAPFTPMPVSRSFRWSFLHKLCDKLCLGSVAAWIRLHPDPDRHCE